MPFTFESRANSISAEQVKAAHENMLLNSTAYASYVSDIENAGENVHVVVVDGASNPNTNFPNPIIYGVTADTDSVVANSSTVVFSEQLLQETEYVTNQGTGASAALAIERVLAHEIGGHVWQDAMNFDMENEDVGPDSALAHENLTMDDYGEDPRDGYEGSSVSSPPGPINGYDENGDPTTLPESDASDPPSAPPNDGVCTPLYPTGEPEGFPPRSPLVLDVDLSGTIKLSALAATGTYFDLDGDGQAELTAWITGGDGLLARDVNENSNIDDITELFGTSGSYADGFAALRALDSNEDNQITDADTDWDDLVVWIDTNMDARSQEGELHTLDDLGIVSISLNATLEEDRTINGSQITHTATFTTDQDETYEIVDAWFDHNPGMTRNIEAYDFDLRAAFLPTLRGFGTMKDLHIAASIDNGATDTVMSMLIDIYDEITGYTSPAEAFENWSDLEDMVDDLMLEWAGVEGVSPSSRGNHVDARHLEFYEAFTGRAFTQYDQPNPLIEASAWIEAMYAYIKTYFTAQIVAQVIGADLFEEAPNYSLFTAAMDGDMELSQAGIDEIETVAAAAADPVEVWTRFAQFLGYTKGLANVSGAEETMLDTAVDDTNEPSLTDWDDVVSTMIANLGAIIDSPDDWGSFEVLYDNTTNGTSGNDTLNGSNGVNDRILGNDGNDTIDGLSGHDKLEGGAGDDTLTGGDGDDYLIGGSGNDIFVWSSGNDTFVESNTGTDELQVAASTGLVSTDVVDIFRTGSDLVIQLPSAVLLTVDGHFTSAANRVETIRFLDDNSTISLTSLPSLNTYGDAGNDTLTASSLASENVIFGNGGNDELTGLDTADEQLFGGAGVDHLHGLGGEDYLDGGSGDDLLFAGEGNDILHGGAGNDDLRGGVGSPGGDDDDELYGEAGNDILRGGHGADIIDGGDGNDVMYGEWYQESNEEAEEDDAESDDTYYASAGFDQILEGGGFDIIIFPDGVDDGDVTIDRTSDDLILTWDGNSTTIVGYYNPAAPDEDNQYWNNVEELHFEDLTVIDLVDEWSPNDNIFEGNDDDHSYQFDGGVDTVEDDGGYDDIRVGSVYDFSTEQFVVLDPNLLTFTQDGDDLVIGMLGQSDQITILDHFEVSGDHALEEISVANSDIFLDLTTFSSWIFGTSGGDTLNGDGDDDVIFGYAGNDDITAGGGADNVLAGAGNDEIAGDAGADILNGGADNDTIDGGAGDDSINGEAGDDIIDGGDDADFIMGGDGADTLSGGAGDDELQGGAGDDTLDGGAGEDYLEGGDGADTFAIATDAGVTDTVADFDVGTEVIDLTAFSAFEEFADLSSSISQVGGNTEIDLGGSQTLVLLGVTASALDGDNFIFAEPEPIEGTSGNDTLTGTSGDDIILGYAGNDTLKGLAGDDDLDGGADTDTADYTAAAAGVTASLATGTASDDGDGGSDTFTSIENLTGSGYADTLTGDGNANVLSGGAGADSLSGGDGSDTLIGGAGNDTLDGGNNTDTVDYSADGAAVTVNLSTGAATDGSSGTDTLSNIENVTGSTYNDTITGSTGDNVIDGGSAGNDTINAGDGNDTYVYKGGLGTDTFNGQNGTDTADFSNFTSAVWVKLSESTEDAWTRDLPHLGSGTWRIIATLNTTENVIGTGYADLINGDSGVNNLSGGAGVDSMSGEGGNDTIDGGDGNDTLVGGAGDDIINGGNDTDLADYSTSSGAVTVNLATGSATGTSTGTDTLSNIENVTGSNHNDNITGNSGNNILKGGSGNDEYVFAAGGGQDTIFDSAGTDALRFGAGITLSDLTFSYVGDDLKITFSGTPTDQVIIEDHNATSPKIVEKIIFNDTSELYLAITANGSSGNDTMSGSVGPDTINGLAGNDTFNSTLGNDTINAGDDNDTYVYTGGLFGVDVFNGDAGTDTADFSGFASAVWVKLTVLTDNAQTRDNINLGSGAWRVLGTLNSTEKVIGSSAADELYGDSNANVFEGSSGDDKVWGYAGSDTLNGDAGSDNIRGGTGADTMDGGADTDTVNYSEDTAGVTVNLATGSATDGSGSSDTLSNFEWVTGSAYNDTITGSSGANTLRGGSGNDTISGDDEVDTLWGEGGNDTFIFLAASAFSAVDAIKDFNISTTEDVLDISDILDGTSYNHGVDPITDWVEITTDGSNSIVKVDRDGTGGTYGMTQIATLESITGLTDEAALVSSGNLVVA